MSDHDGHGSPFIAHHFDDAKHQFDSGKLGMWAFLAQEVLFFSALFVAYIIYRFNHPEIFEYAHYYLDTTMGAINTAVLICSSLSAAWAVRAAQLNQRKTLIFCLAFTILCAFGFLGIKYVEYSHKIHGGVLFGKYFNPSHLPNGAPMPGYVGTGHGGGHGDEAAPEGDGHGADAKSEHAGDDHAPKAEGHSAEGAHDAAAAKAESAGAHAAAEAHGQGGHGADDGAHHGPVSRPPPNTGMFFTIYFAMTGLHGIHVLVGIGIFIWLLIRAIKGHFSEDYFGPIDFAALYWHLVDLIWIYLFPLLYLIH